MFILDGAVVTSASDLTTASKCEFAFAFARQLDTKLGRTRRIVVPEDPMLKRAGRLGDEHESRQLEKYRAAGLRDVPSALYYERIRANPVALMVKLADLNDNLDPERVAQLDEAMRDRLQAKYSAAFEALTGDRT